MTSSCFANFSLSGSLVEPQHFRHIYCKCICRKEFLYSSNMPQRRSISPVDFRLREKSSEFIRIIVASEKIKSDTDTSHQNIKSSREESEREFLNFDWTERPHMPQPAIQAIETFYLEQNSSPGRGLCTQLFSRRASEVYDESRSYIAQFLGLDASQVTDKKDNDVLMQKMSRVRRNADHISSESELIFTESYEKALAIILAGHIELALKRGDEIVMSKDMSSIAVRMVNSCANNAGFKIKYFNINSNQKITMDHIVPLLSGKTKAIFLSYTAGTSGKLNDIETIGNIGKSIGAITIVDISSSWSRMKINIQKFGCDWVLGCGNSLMVPGIAILCGRQSILQRISPPFPGNDTADQVTPSSSKYSDIPSKFEPALVPIPKAVALKACCKMIIETGFEEICKREFELAKYCAKRLAEISNSHGSICVLECPNDLNQLPVVVYRPLIGNFDDFAWSLRKRGILFSIGRKDQGQNIKLTCHFRLTVEDIDKMVDITSQVLDVVTTG